MRQLNNTRLFLMLILFSPLTLADEVASNNPFAWDLSYMTVFSENDVPQKDTIRKYFNDTYQKKGNLKDMHLPDELFADIELATIKTALLIDYQVYWFFGHRLATLYLDNGQSVVARSYNSKSKSVQKYKVRPGSFENFSTDIMNRNQSVPLGGYSFQVSKGYSFSGYIGVISRYSNDGTTQKLITVEDLLHSKTEQGEIAQLMKAMQRNMKPVYEND